MEELSRRLTQRGHRVTVYCRPHYVNGSPDFEGVERVFVWTLKEKHSEMIIHTGLSLLNSFARRFDIIHFQSVDPAILSMAGRLKARVVVTSHGKAYRVAKWGKLAKSMSMLAERFYVRVPQSRIAVSKTLADYYRREYRCAVKYIPNGVTVPGRVGNDRLSGFSLTRGEYILFVGRLTESKGCHLLIEACKRLGSTMPLVIVGGSDYPTPYYRQLRREESPAIRFLDFRFGEDLRQLLANCRMFVMPSESEGLSVSLLEAMACGRPVICSDIPGNMEAAGECGISFRSGGSEDLTGKMRYLLDNPELGEELGKAGIERVKREYDWEKIAGATEEVYLGLFD